MYAAPITIMIITITLLIIITITNALAQCAHDRKVQPGWLRTPLSYQNYRCSELLHNYHHPSVLIPRPCAWQKGNKGEQIIKNCLSSLVPSHCCLYNPNSTSSKTSPRSFHTQEIKWLSNWTWIFPEMKINLLLSFVYHFCILSIFPCSLSSWKNRKEWWENTSCFFHIFGYQFKKCLKVCR